MSLAQIETATIETATIACDSAVDAPAISASGRLYRQIYESRSPAELHEIAHAKRFLEVYRADAEVRAAISDPAQREATIATICETHAIAVPRDQLATLFVAEDERDPNADTLATRWARYSREIVVMRDQMLQDGFSGGRNPAFDAWRARQIARLAGELGGNIEAHTHPALAFELCDGCSVGCWFCGISAAKFGGHWPYAANRAMWRAVLDETVALLGAAAATGFCYWGTDPADNPDYADFILDYYRKTGAVPQTTSAVPLKDIAATRRIMAVHGRYGTTPNRFSILNRKYLKRIHEAFTAEELLRTEAVMQLPNSDMAKALAGRAMEKAAGKKDQIVSDSTIACVTGFLVNMPKGRVQLITPTRATTEVPNGYYVFGERHFTTAAEYGAALRELASTHMTRDLKASDTLAFRPDVTVAPHDDGVALRDSSQNLSIDTASGRLLGAMLANGQRATLRSVLETAARAQGDLDDLGVTIARLFRGGMFQEKAMLAHYQGEAASA